MLYSLQLFPHSSSSSHVTCAHSKPLTLTLLTQCDHANGLNTAPKKLIAGVGRKIKTPAHSLIHSFIRTGAGGGMSVTATTVVFQNSTEISYNQAVYGGGLFLIRVSTYQFNVSDVTVSHNVATRSGGGIFAQEQLHMELARWVTKQEGRNQGEGESYRETERGSMRTGKTVDTLASERRDTRRDSAEGGKVTKKTSAKEQNLLSLIPHCIFLLVLCFHSSVSIFNNTALEKGGGMYCTAARIDGKVSMCQVACLMYLYVEHMRAGEVEARRKCSILQLARVICL